MKMIYADVFDLPSEERAWLEGHGLEVEDLDDEAPYAGDPSTVDIVMCKRFFDYNDIGKFTSLRYIQLFMAGFEHLPMDYIESHGIEFHNARDVYSIPIAEFGIGGILDLYKKTRAFEAEQREHVWNMRRFLQELTYKKVLIVGAGSIGSAFAKRLQAFDCHVTGLARTARPIQYFDEVLPMASLDACLPEADIVITCLPNNDSTHHVMGAEQFGQMKEGSLFVNIARGPLADEAALTQALQSGHLGGAVLDVFEVEPLPEDSPLWDMENVIVRPHTSFGAEYNQDRIFQVMRRNLEASTILPR